MNMYDDDDPLERWLENSSPNRGWRAKEMLESIRNDLRGLEANLDGIAWDPQRPKEPYRLSATTYHPRLSREELAVAQSLYGRVLEKGGTRSKDNQRALLSYIGCTGDVLSLPCWQETLRVVRPRDAVVGELGFRKGHRLVELFDYGDRHIFEIKLTDMLPQASGREYPRIVATTGKPPEQYGR